MTIAMPCPRTKHEEISTRERLNAASGYVRPVPTRNEGNLHEIVIVRDIVPLDHGIAHVEQQPVSAEDMPAQQMIGRRVRHADIIGDSHGIVNFVLILDAIVLIPVGMTAGNKRAGQCSFRKNGTGIALLHPAVRKQFVSPVHLLTARLWFEDEILWG